MFFIEVTAKGWLWSQQLGLYLGVESGKLRFFTPNGQLVMLPEEEANQQLQQANQQLQQANQELEQERQRAAILAERLRTAGIDPEEIFLSPRNCPIKTDSNFVG